MPTWVTILAVLFRGSRESGFCCTFLSSPWQGGPAYWRMASTTLYWFRNLDIRAKSAEATTSVGLAKKIMKCSGLWLFDGASWAASSGTADASCECVYGSLGIRCCGFIFKPGELSPYRQGSRLHPASNIVKDGVKSTLGLGVRSPGMIRFCRDCWLEQVRPHLWASVSPGEH